MRKEARRIDSKSSRTADYTCMYRAASYLEKNELYKSEDYIAPRLLPGLLKFLVKYRLINFNLIENLNSEDLEKMFFRDEYGNIMAKINGTHCIAHVKK